MCSVLGATPVARAQSSPAPAWYQEIREIAEALIKRELGTNAARQISIRSPALCFYLRETLSRVQSGYWGNVPDKLKTDLRDALADLVFSVASAETAPTSIGQALRSFWTVAEARYRRLVELRAASTLPVCSTEWWEAETSQPLRVETFVESQCTSPQTLKEHLGCTLANSVTAFMGGERAEAKSLVLELAGSLVLKAYELELDATLSSDTRVAERLLKNWVEDPESAQTALRTIESQLPASLVSSLDESGDCSGLAELLTDLTATRANPFKHARCLLGHEGALKSTMRLVIGTHAVEVGASLRQEQISEAFGAARELGKVTAVTDPAVCNGAAHVKGQLEVAGVTRELVIDADGGAFCKPVVEELKLVATVVKVRREIAEAREELENAAKVFGEGIEIHDFWALRGLLTRVTGSLRHVAKSAKAADWTLGLTLKFLHELVRSLPESQQVDELKAVLGRHELRKLLQVAERKNYRNSMTSLLTGLDAHGIELEVFREFLVYTADVTSDDRGAAKEAFRAAALGFLGHPSEGLPTAKDGASWGLSRNQILRPALSLRINPSSDFDSWKSVSVGLSAPRLAVSFHAFLGAQATLLDLLGPATELAYRDQEVDHDNQRLLALDFVRPRLELYAFFPPFSRRLALTAGFGLRFVESKANAEMPHRYELATKLQFELSVMLAL